MREQPGHSPFLAGLRFHDLRHEAVSRLLELGLSPLEVGVVSGHKTLAMLQRYANLRVADIAAKIG
jgi:integrase